MFATVLISTSCCKEDDPFNEDPTSGELYPAYVGVWENESTYLITNLTTPITDDGKRREFEIQAVKAIQTTVDKTQKVEYETWSVSGNDVLTLKDIVGDDGTYTLTVISPPFGGKMTLEANVYRYNLTK